VTETIFTVSDFTKQSGIASPYFVFVEQSVRASPYFWFYGSELQSFAVFWFLKYRVTELHLEFVSRDRLSETYFVVNDQSKVTWNARQRIKLSSTLPRDPKTCSGALQELNKATAF